MKLTVFNWYSGNRDLPLSMYIIVYPLSDIITPLLAENSNIVNNTVSA